MTVYRASAGAGKTFTLAVRFIELLIENPYSYKETLAVTFTNKATEEMKQRILSQLYGLANNLPDSKSYMDRITSDLGCTKQEVSKKADFALHLMLHDYSNFNVETIDAFFQRVLRNLAHELELNANLRVELNNDEIEEMAVDKLIAELKQNDKALKWIINYIEQNMAEDKNWKVVDNIRDFGKKIFQQGYKENADELNAKIENNGKFFELYIQSLRKIIKDADTRMKEIGDKFFEMIDNEGYTITNFTGGARGPVSYFRKLQGGAYIGDKRNPVYNTTAQKAADGAEGWVNKGDLKSQKATFAGEILVPYLNNAEEERKACCRNVASAKVILKNINELRLLNDIEREVQEINRDSNRFLLNDTQNLLNELMKDTDAPFVFEKIGGRIMNIMIDEFQDTSTIQWQNFKKLLLECMSHDSSLDLIVGDVKQSIYRWRNGDWSLLNNIKEDKDLIGKDVKLDKLDTNYRSETNIINFNNKFFVEAANSANEILKKDGNDNGSILTDIYSEELVKQEYPKGKDEHGLVDITLLAETNSDYTEACQTMVKEYVLNLIENGARDEDIAILIRGNKDISRLANWLQQEIPDHNFISDEAYLLDNSTAVNILVNALKVLVNQEEPLLKAELTKKYQQYILGNRIDETVLGTTEGADKLLPHEFVYERERLLTLPVSDLVDKLSTLFDLQKLSNESAYTDAFMDQLNTFTSNNVPDIDQFLEAWKLSIHEKKVKGGDLQGIRLMTIHKSKGLEFDHVIIPFASWNLDKGSTLWCKTDEAPFSEMPIVPVDSSKLKDTIYSKDYYEEKLQSIIDNTNMLYVAFTRAAKNLYVIGQNAITNNGLSSSKVSSLIQMTLPSLKGKLEGCEMTGDISKKDESIHFTYGSLYIKNKQEKSSENVFLQKSEKMIVDANVHSQNMEFRQSNRSRTFVASTEDAPDNQHYITQGTVMHSVLSQIHDASEVERVLNDFLQEGVISDNDKELNRKTLSKLIRNRIDNNPLNVVNRWFSKDVEVFNECSILSTDPETGTIREQRPDRVVKDGDKMTVIDFKFGKPREEYKSQVRGYMSLLRDMGYPNVTGYLWYVYNNKVEVVEAE